MCVERGADGHFRITYDDGAAFVIDATASRVFATTPGELNVDEVVVRLQGPILGFVLRLRGVTCLHASAAVADGRAFALVGAAGAGKSTSAAALAQLGLPVLTDDVLALRDGRTSFEAEPGLPRVLLWPESVSSLFGNPGALPRVMNGWDKHYLALARPGYHFARRAAPLGAVYLLGDRLPAGTTPEITSLQGTSALAWLLANTYANNRLDDRLRVGELELLGRFVTHVPVRLVRVPDDPGAITRACQAVIADFANRN